jgi:uncharacterized protein (TIGR02452 family)
LNVSARLRAIAADNGRIVRGGRYTARDGRVVVIGEAVRAAAEATRTYGPGPVPLAHPLRRVPTGTRFEVTAEDSLAAARRLLDKAALHTPSAPIAPAGGDGAPVPAAPAARPDGDHAHGSGSVAVLVFASARNPGGGYVNGAKAQEEAICRASALHPCLLRVPEFYAAHRASSDLFYSDRVIHSPAVPVFRTADAALLECWYPVGFLTCPAPNTGVVARREPGRLAEVPALLERRAGRVLEVAVAHGYRQLVLGAWGCGVFGNDPEAVAGAFRRLLTRDGRFAGHFERVVFAVLGGERSGARAAFARAFA